MLPKIKLINSDLMFTRIGFGCEQLGLHNWGDIDTNQMEKAVSAAVDCGINFFDTADVYGLGKSEENLGKFLNHKRKQIQIISKFGVRFNNSNRFFDNSPKWIESALNFSLKRLKTDYIDLYQLHYWDETTPLELIFESLEKFKTEGKIRAYGFSNILDTSLPMLGDFFKNSSIFSYEFSLVERRNESLIRKLNSEMTFLAYGILGQGILSGKYNTDSVFPQNDRRRSERYRNFHGKKLINNLHIVNELQKLSEKYGFSIPNLAIRYNLDYFPNSCAIIGFKNLDQLENTLKTCKLSLDNSDFNNLTKISYEYS